MSTVQQEEQNFSKLRQALFPIYNWELKKFLPMAIIMLCILFNYTVVRNLKDVLINNAAVSGPEAIPYIKGLFVTTAAIAFVILYSKLANIFSSEKLFYILTSTFLVFFGLFPFVIYPNIDLLHPSTEAVQALQAEFPRIHFLISVWGVWTYSAFYILAELWGSVLISLLFWQFANEIIRTNEAKRFYPMFVLLGNIALILSGTAMTSVAGINEDAVDMSAAFHSTLTVLCVLFVIMGVIAMTAYRWMHKNVLKDPKYYDGASKKAEKKSKPKMGMWDSFKYIFTNPYVGLIALLVLSYGMSINLIEIVWKKQVTMYFAGDRNAYSAFQGSFATYTGIATIAITFLTKNIVNRFGWFTGAVITPAIIAATGALFYALMLMGDTFSPMLSGCALSATYAAVMVGLIQNVLSKATKYALFDPTKEMAYIPLDQELKTKGKAVVDVIGGRLGKAAGGYTVMGLFAVTATKDLMCIVPYLGHVIAAIMVAWIFGVFALNRRYKTAIAAKEKEGSAA